MAAVVHLDESNDYPEVVTHAVTSLAMGTADASGMTPGASGARQPAGSSGMQKALRLHLTDLGGATGIANIRVFCDPSAPHWSLWTNASDEPSQYVDSQITDYIPPTTSEVEVPHPLPESEPGNPNLGILGNLAGQLSAPGQSDYCYIQLRAGALATESFQSPFFAAYDEIG